MVDLLLVRHAEPLVNAQTSAADWPLSERGRVRAAALAHTLVTLSQTAEVWSSPQRKAWETAALAVPGLTPTVRDELSEVERPPYPDAETHRAAASEYLSGRDIQGWEPHASVHQRLQTLERRLPATGHLIVVSHGVLLTKWIQHVVGLEEPARFWSDMTLPDVWALDFATRTVTSAVTAPRPRSMR
ncbi:MAG TPA: histidine phosphatase family protein [Acidimicrobiales bacterium]|nr:histidine phosphatase family protein [Acidimicrobiales bacterium]